VSPVPPRAIPSTVDWQAVANQMLGALIEASGLEESSRRVFHQSVKECSRLAPMTRKCSGCGAEIFWVKTPTGRTMPLDARSQIYELAGGDLDGTPIARITSGAWVSHFRTCPKAGQFSGRNRSTPPPTTEGQCAAEPPK